MSEAGKSPRQFSVGLKREMVSRLEAGEAVGKAARETGIARKLLYDWLKAYQAPGARRSTVSAARRLLCFGVQN